MKHAMGNTIGSAVLAVLLVTGGITAARADTPAATGPQPVPSTPGDTSVPVAPSATHSPEKAAGQGSQQPTSGGPSVHDIVNGDNPEQQMSVQAQPAASSPAQPAAQSVSASSDGHADVSQLPLGGLIDRELRSADHNTLGRVVDVLVGADGTVSAVVADVGGFMGVGNRKVAIAWSLLSLDHADPKGAVVILAPAAFIRSAPEYKAGDREIAVVTGPRFSEKPKASPDKGAENTPAPHDANATVGVALVPTQPAASTYTPAANNPAEPTTPPHADASPQDAGATNPAPHDESQQTAAPSPHRIESPHANAK